MLGKVVLITGASSGIGAGTAALLASKGCKLSLTGRSVKGLEETRQECIKTGSTEDNVLLIPADLDIQENLTMIVEKTVNHFKKLDVLVNNAGRINMIDFENISAEEYDTTMNTNMKSAFFLTQAALPHLIESKGNIVNVSSVLSQVPLQSSIIYGMTKASMDYFTKTLALDVASKNVRVNAVNPGSIDTPIYQPPNIPLEYRKAVEKRHAMGRFGTVEEAARSIAFLANNEESSFITGVTLLVDGGYSLMGSA